MTMMFIGMTPAVLEEGKNKSVAEITAKAGVATIVKIMMFITKELVIGEVVLAPPAMTIRIQMSKKSKSVAEITGPMSISAWVPSSRGRLSAVAVPESLVTTTLSG